MVEARQGVSELDLADAEQIVGPERGERVSQLDRLNRRLNVIAAPGQLHRYAAQHSEGEIP